MVLILSHHFSKMTNNDKNLIMIITIIIIITITIIIMIIITIIELD